MIRNAAEMQRMILATCLIIATSALMAVPSQAERLPTFDSCEALRAHLEGRRPYEHVSLARNTYECTEPLILSVDGLSVDFGRTLIRVANNALRPGIVIGDLHTPPERRHTAITVSNVRVEGNRKNQEAECWGGPCDPVVNHNPLWQQRLNGITVNGCDDCALIDVEVRGARSGGVVVVSSNRLLMDGLLAENAHFDGLAAYGTHDSTFRNVRVRHNGYSGFSFDCNFSGNKIEDFDTRDNRHHGLFIRHASGNTFAHGSLAHNGLDGAYFDRSRPDEMRTCATDTHLESVEVTSSGRYGAWLDYPCEGNRFSSSRIIDSGRGCFGGRSADLIGRSDDTECVAPPRDVVVEAAMAIEQQAFERALRGRQCPLAPFRSGPKRAG